MREKTIFDSSLLPAIKIVSTMFMSLTGWKIVGFLPEEARKSVVLAVPHVSNWDLLFTLLVAIKLDMRIYFVAKKSLFRVPVVGHTLSWLGGVPVDRGHEQGFVATWAEYLRNSEAPVQLVIAPEGTRRVVPLSAWRGGFYHIAKEAKVPILFSFVDYRKRVAGLSLKLINTDHDLAHILEWVENHYKELLEQKKERCR